VTIKNANIKGFRYGIDLDASSHNSIFGNNITANLKDGISLDGSSYNSIFSSSVIENEDGIGLFSSSNYNSVYGNHIIENDFDGIEVRNSSYNRVYGNNITENDEDGIDLYEVSYNSIFENNITKNWVGGIDLGYSSNNNNIFGNTMVKNYPGIYFEQSSNNVFYHNNFINNSRQVVDESWDRLEVPPSVNVWDDDYPSGGNYWSNYTGVDADNDGIGETAHAIDANNTDRYPLMGMFSDFNATLEHHTQTVCNSTISDFYFNGTAICFNVTGDDGTLGFCRICIPTALISSSYRVYINNTEITFTLLPFSNSTRNYVYFNYTHSTEQVTIIPEFPSTTILAVLVALTMLAAALTRKDRSKEFS
jgi:parallel beta-helix repeat protein